MSIACSLHNVMGKISKITSVLISSGFTTSATFKMADSVAENRKMYVEMPVGEKRAQYKCGNNFVTLDKVETWASKSQNLEDSVKVDRNKLNKYTEAGFGPFSSNPSLNQSVSMWAGDITTLEIDAIVNAANESLMGGGGVDGAIHRAAGPQLKAECATLHGCPTGQAKITGGYKLPAKYIIHTVGPRGEKPDLLKSCYQNCLEILRKENLRSIAFPCISTGIYGYPQENAAKVALTTVRKFMDQHPDSIERVIFCLFLKEDIEIYSRLMQVAFPAQ
uniref:Macro domain-containing protein n=2 Tax=Homalodisca liturata TaxID=320908 RepID=A0A1B6IAR3_9HEMI